MIEPKTVLAALQVVALGIFPRRQFISSCQQGGFWYEIQPFASSDGAHGWLPILPVQLQGRGLHRALNQQTQFIPALRRSGNFPPVPEQIKFFVADKALTRSGFPAARCEFGFDTEPGKCSLNPFMSAAVAFLGAEAMPLVPGWKCKTVSPIRIVRHNAPTRRTADQWAQERGWCDFGKSLEVAERGGWLSPAVETEHRLLQMRGVFIT
jgi:hypothetical protein